MKCNRITENNRVTLQYKTGVNEFIRAARRFPNKMDKYRCHCKPCNNMRWHDIGVVRNHLLNKGFTPGYTKWYHHGELERVVLSHEEDSIGGTDQRGIGGLHGAVEDIRDHEDFDDATEPTRERCVQRSKWKTSSPSWKRNCTLDAKSFLLCRYWFH